MAADGDGDKDKENLTTPEHGKISPGSGFAVGGACVGAGLAAIGGGYAIARVGGHCIESMARQPEAAGSMFAPMIVTAAMIEGAMLFAIAVALLAVLKTL
ncbi:MAG: ATP synthase F0 subunit C [Phycisphaerae bacterium]|nr:ATP synthase F0 subunit C [Phycisphaerae bacterium]